MAELDIGAQITRTMKRLNKWADDAERAMGATLLAGAVDIHRDAVESITGGGKTGNVYKRGQKTHTASAPGEAPASDTGRLVSSMGFTAGKDRKGVFAEVFASTEYAADLEYGTRNMEARPFMRPALKKNEKKIEAAAIATIRKTVAKNADK